MQTVLHPLTKTKMIIVVNGNKWASLTETQIETIILAKTGKNENENTKNGNQTEILLNTKSFPLKLKLS